MSCRLRHAARFGRGLKHLKVAKLEASVGVAVHANLHQWILSPYKENKSSFMDHWGRGYIGQDNSERPRPNWRRSCARCELLWLPFSLWPWRIVSPRKSVNPRSGSLSRILLVALATRRWG